MKRSTRLQKQKEKVLPKEIISGDWERGVNSQGLPILPDELLLEILAYYPPIALPTLSDEPINTEAHVARRDMMLALSLSCSNLRRFFHPYIWERIEVCAGMPASINGTPVTLKKGIQSAKKVAMDKAFSEELIRQLEIVTVRDPTLAKSVKIVNVELSKFAIQSVLKELGRCFDLFTNMHTVKLISLEPHNDAAARREFGKYMYPNVRKLILSSLAFPLVHSCPSTRTLQCSVESHIIIPYLKGKVWLLERISCKITPNQIATYAYYLPKLMEVNLFVNENYILYQKDFWANLQLLNRFGRLDTIVLEFYSLEVSHKPYEHKIRDLLLGILKARQAKDNRRKRLCIYRTRSYDPVLFEFDAPMEEIIMSSPKTPKMKVN